MDVAIDPTTEVEIEGNALSHQGAQISKNGVSHTILLG